MLIPETSGATIGENHTVEDAEDQFLALKHHGEALGWLNDESQGAIDPSSANHYQGLVRYPGDGVPVFYVTQKDGDDGGYLHVVRFGTRPTTGERLRSNLQESSKDTEDTYPPVADTWVRSIRFDGSLLIDGNALPAYVHPGGMAIVDDILFVPLDTPLSSSSPTGTIVLFDLSDDAAGRENPTPIQAIPLVHKIDNLAVIEYPGEPGTYLIWTNGDGGDITKFYGTNTSDLRDDALQMVLLQNWHPKNDLKDSEGWPGDDLSAAECAHQSSTFLRDANGSLYMIAMRHGFRLSGPAVCGSPDVGADTADLFKVETVNERFTLFEKDKKRFYCVYDGGGGPGSLRLCNFAAASTAYVSPSGELILYSIPHDDEDGFKPADIVRMGEFRHRDVYRENNPLRYPTAVAGGPYIVEEGGTVTLSGSGAPPADRPWVELYDDKNFDDRSIVVDYDDRNKLELNNFNNLDGFNDKTSSVRWRAPVGLDIWLYKDDNFRGDPMRLAGTGFTAWIPNLDDHNFGDKTSSLNFPDMPSAAVILEWDLDADGVFGETGAAATRGDETGETPSFDAADLDGPTQVNVTLRVTFSGVVEATDTAVINVENVAPIVSIDNVTDATTGLEIGSGLPLPVALVELGINVAGSFTDPGTADTHTATMDWGDGTIDHLGDVVNVVNASHVYVAPGGYTLTLAVTDDDGGVGITRTQITVVDAQGAISIIVDSLRSLATDSNIAAAIANLEGQASGEAQNGAIDLLEKGNLNAALEKIKHAIQYLEAAEAADPTLDLRFIKDLLALTAKSVAINTVVQAEAVAPKPNELRKIQQAKDLVAQGDMLLVALDHVGAVNKYQQAVRKVQGKS